jgi:hypothetical protein
MVVRAPLAVALAVALAPAAACSSKSKAVEDAHDARRTLARPADAAPAPPEPPPTGPYRIDAKTPRGDVLVHVEWKDVPIAARAPRGDTACGTPLPPAVSPTTMWGIPDVFVWVEADHGKRPPDRDARIWFDGCTPAPRVAVADRTLAIASTAEHPVQLALARAGALARFGEIGKPGGTEVRPVLLPIAGHAVTATLDPGIYELAERGHEIDGAWILAGAPYAEVTGGNGDVTVKDLPVGSYPIVAWLPPRANAPARFAKGKVAIAAGKRAEIALQLVQVP